jgi:hypothetical protein
LLDRVVGGSRIQSTRVWGQDSVLILGRWELWLQPEKVAPLHVSVFSNFGVVRVNGTLESNVTKHNWTQDQR